jgi:putative glutamine amidotransferase
VHVHADYDRHSHDIVWDAESGLARLYPDNTRGGIVSIHHQAIRTLGRGLQVEARSADDEMIEAVRLEGGLTFFGVQWHPEFHPPGSPTLLDCTPILDEFLNARSRMVNRRIGGRDAR